MESKVKFTLIEAIIIIMLLLIIGSLFLGIDTEKGTKEIVERNAKSWMTEQGIYEYKRFSAAGDSDSDGWGTVTIVLKDGEKIYLQCRSYGSNTCKEVDTHQKINKY